MAYVMARGYQNGQLQHIRQAHLFKRGLLLPNADKTILGHLGQTRQNVQSTKPIQLAPRSSLPPAIETPEPLVDASREVFLPVYPISKLYTDDMGRFPVQARLGNQLSWLLITWTGTLFYNKLFRQKLINTAFLLSTPSWHGWLLAGFLLISISEITKPVQTSNNSSQSHGKLSSNLFLQTCTWETKPSGWLSTSNTTSSLFLLVLTLPFHHTFGISFYPRPNWLLI